VKKTLQTIAAIAVVGGSFIVGKVSDFEADLIPIEDDAAVHVTLGDSIVEGHWLHLKQAGRIVDSVWRETDTLFAGGKSRQVDLRDLCGDGTGEVAIGDTFWIYARHHVDKYDSSYSIVIKYWPRIECALPKSKILMYQFLWQVFERDRPPKDTVKVVEVIP
jgi:hypothetical protein